MRFAGMKFFSFILTLFVSIFITNSIIVSSLLIASKISWGLAVLSSVLLGLLTIVFGFLFKKWSLIWTALIAIVGSLLCGMYISDYADLQGREIIRNISTEEAIEYPEAAGYIFSDGFVNSELGVTYQKTNTSTDHTSVTYYYAAPVVYKDWDQSKPVFIFVVGETLADTKTWKSPFRAGIRAPASYFTELRTAVNRCIDVHTLKCFKDPIMIKWVKSPKEAIKKYKDDMLETLLIWNIVLVLGILIFKILSYLNFRKNISNKIENASVKSREKISRHSIFRILFSFYTFYILIYSLHFSKYDFSQLLPLSLLVFALVFYIIAFSAIQIAHNKNKRTFLDLLYLVLYPYFAYFLIFFQFDFGSSSLWLFCGLFYFLVITGGFIFGILLSPLISRKDISNQLKNSKGMVKTGKFKLMLFVFFGGIFAVLSLVFLKLLKAVQNLETYRIFIFYLLLIFGIGMILKFTFRHTIFKPNKDLIQK